MYTLTHHIVSLPTSQYIQEFRNPEKFISFCRQCERYNRCWACPPFEFNTDEYLSGYQQTYIIGTKIAFDTATRDSCTTLEEHKTISLQTIESVRKIIDPRLLTLEDEYSGRPGLLCRDLPFMPPKLMYPNKWASLSPSSRNTPIP